MANSEEPVGTALSRTGTRTQDEDDDEYMFAGATAVSDRHVQGSRQGASVCVELAQRTGSGESPSPLCLEARVPTLGFT